MAWGDDFKVGDKIYWEFGTNSFCRGKIAEIVTDRDGIRWFKLTWLSQHSWWGWIGANRITAKRN